MSIGTIMLLFLVLTPQGHMDTAVAQYFENIAACKQAAMCFTIMARELDPSARVRWECRTTDHIREPEPPPPPEIARGGAD